MKSYQMVGGPTLFELCEDASSGQDVPISQTPLQEKTTRNGGEKRPSSSAAFAQGLQTPVEEPKRRRTYQFGTLKLRERKRPRADVWTFRYSKWVDGKRIRARVTVTVGTILEHPTEADALRACEHLRMEANAENPLRNAAMRGLIDCVINDILQPCLEVPIGGEVSEDAELQYSTACNYMSHLRCYILPKWGSYSVKDFEKLEIQNSVETWLRSLKRSKTNPDGLAPKSVGQVHATMRMVLRYGVKWGYLKFHPFSAGVIVEDCPRFGFHNLRHGLSTFLIENGHDPVVVQRMLRQSHVDMTMHYVHNQRMARDAQGQFIERFLPNRDTFSDAEEQRDEERVQARVQ